MQIIFAISRLRALAQETRLAAFRLLVREGPKGLAAGELARRLEVNASTLSRHLAALEAAGLVTSRRQDRHILYAVNYEGIRDLVGFLLEDCCRNDPACLPAAVSAVVVKSAPRSAVESNNEGAQS